MTVSIASSRSWSTWARRSSIRVRQAAAAHEDGQPDPDCRHHGRRCQRRFGYSWARPDPCSRASAAGRRLLEPEQPGPRIIDRNFEPGFFVEHFIKDMGIALDEARGG